MKQILFIFSMLISFIGLSQEFYYTGYDWLGTPEKFVLSTEEQSKDVVYLRKKDVVELVIKNDQPVEYRLSHRIIQLNTDLGIEQFNKMYLSNRNIISSEIQKARVIKPNGDIVVQNSKDIKESLNEDGEVEYVYFAFEGLEKGSIIEVIELGLFPARLTGAGMTLQSKVIMKNVEFEVISPKQLKYAFYSVNGAPEMRSDSTAHDGYNKMFLKLTNVKAIEKQDMAAVDASFLEVFYKFDKNLNSNRSNLYNYNNVTHNIYEIFMKPLPKAELKAINSFIKGLKFTDGMSEEDKIRAIETELKHKFMQTEFSCEPCMNMAFVTKNKVLDSDSYVRFMYHALKAAGIESQFVYTCNRFQDKFPLKYEAYNFLRDILLYVPKYNKYLEAELFSRYGFPSEDFINQNGLFIREINMLGTTSAVGEIKHIDYPKMDESVDYLDVKMQLIDGNSTAKIFTKRTTTGYKASVYQVYFDYVDEESRKNIIDGYVGYLEDGAVLSEVKMENDKSNLVGVKPLIGEGTFESKNFVEHAGDKLLVKAGGLIGPQSSLYNKEERVLPVEAPQTRKYVRRLVIEIPAGYEAKNLDELNFNVTPFGEKGHSGFKSTYKVEGNTIVVDVEEWYNQLTIEVAEYKGYESVINAAADFNKVVLILASND